MNNQFDEETEKAFGEIFHADSIVDTYPIDADSKVSSGGIFQRSMPTMKWNSDSAEMLKRLENINHFNPSPEIQLAVRDAIYRGVSMVRSELNSEDVRLTNIPMGDILKQIDDNGEE